MAVFGAGASKAGGLPLTEELLEKIYPRSGVADWHRRRTPAQWRDELAEASRVLYPDGAAPGFRPSASDFFTILEVVAGVHANRERLPINGEKLLKDLRGEIALGLHELVDQQDVANSAHAAWLNDGARRPDVVITSNWDNLIEAAAVSAGVPVRFLWPTSRGSRVQQLEAGTLVVLKLHGSIDWGLYPDRSVRDTPVADWYCRLETAVNGRSRFGRGSQSADLVLRFTSLEGALDDAGSGVGFTEPLMATMAASKQRSIRSLARVWDDAYWCLSRASEIDIVGYSFPLDDLEIRTLLRTTTRRAGQAALDPGVEIWVRNPAPEAHDRARSYLGATISSDYQGAERWLMDGA